MGECDQISISVAHVPTVRKESEDFGRDLVDRCDAVSPGPNEVEDFESILFENIELEIQNTSVTIRASILFVRFNLSLIQSHRDPAKTSFSSPTRRVSPAQTYFFLRVTPCRISLAARKCWNTDERVDMIVDVTKPEGFSFFTYSFLPDTLSRG